MCYTYTLLSHEEHTTVLPSASIKHDESAWQVDHGFRVRHEERRQRGWSGKYKQLRTMLEKDMLLWKSFSSLENIFSVESGIKRHFSNTELWNDSGAKEQWPLQLHMICNFLSDCKTARLTASDRKTNSNFKCGALFLWWHHLWHYRNLRWPLEAEVATVEHMQYKSLHHMMSLLIIHYDTHTALW